jgi:tetratricopeptide (TPR) repeat protein
MNPAEADFIQYPFGAVPRRLTNFIPESDAGIIGRDEELVKTHQNLHTGRPAVLVNGIGGMGKTTIAAKYIVRYFQEYQHFAWLTVQGSLKETFYNNTALLDSLQLRDEVRALVEARQSDAAFELVFKKLNDLEKTLVVLDNANDLADLVEMKKHFDRAHCHCLLTSRAQPPAWQIVEVKPLPDLDAIALFRSHYPAPDADDATVGDLLKRLDGHTLLIELVAKSAAASGIGVAELQRILREKFIHDPALNKRSVETGAHGDNLDTLRRAKVEEYIWLIFKNIADLPPTAQELLRAFALLPPATAFDEDFLEKHAAHFGIEGNIFDTLDRLVEYGWLEKANAHGEKPAFKMHPLIADVTLRHLDVNVEYAKTYIAVVADQAYYDATNPQHNLFEVNKKRPLAERLSDLFFEENTEEVSELLDNLRRLDQEFGFYQKAARFGRRALDICESILEEGHLSIATRQSNLATVLHDLGDYEGAKKLLEKALASNEKNFGQDHLTTARDYSNLALVFKDLGDYEKAKKLLEKALASDEKNFGEEHPSTAIRYSNLATVFHDLGDYEGAKKLLEKALASDEKNFGEEHPNTAMRYSNLALVFEDLGDYERAKKLTEKAISTYEKIFGPDHFDVARCQSNLAAMLIQTGQKAEARPLLESARRIYIEKLGPQHPHVARVESWFSGLE